MANESKKDFNAMLLDSKGMPRIQTITDPKSIRKYGGSRMLLAPPLAYDGAMKQVHMAGSLRSGKSGSSLRSRAGLISRTL